MTGNGNPSSRQAGPVWGAPKNRRRTAPLEVSQATAVRRTVFPPPWTPTDPTLNGRAISSKSGYKDALSGLGWHVLCVEVMQSLDSARRAFDSAGRHALAEHASDQLSDHRMLRLDPPLPGMRGVVPDMAACDGAAFPPGGLSLRRARGGRLESPYRVRAGRPPPTRGIDTGRLRPAARVGLWCPASANSSFCYGALRVARVLLGGRPRLKLWMVGAKPTRGAPASSACRVRLCSSADRSTARPSLPRSGSPG